jgi:UDP-N-acetylglucosamine--N-acetylmuramyl-(pentapeptide) pyrophosphoryl-undecaprenol N-acetylglucosamine transferase
MKVVISGGGTAGHVNPAIATALELESRGCEVVYIGTPTGPESTLVPAQGIRFVPLEAAGFNRHHPLTLFTSSAKVLKSSHKAERMFDEQRPDAVVGFGGYVSLPVGMAAHHRHIPLVIHEQNSVPGLTNRNLAKHAYRVAVTYDISRDYLDGVPPERIVVTGNPVRASVLAGDRTRGRERLGVSPDALLLIVMGGSLGARHLNEALVGLRDELMAIDGLVVVQSTGRKNFEDVTSALGDVDPDRWKVYAYLDNVGDDLAACDCIVSRAGASSLAEITAVGLPSLLVPYPYATDDHQTKNARDLEREGACIMVADADVESPRFARELTRLLMDGELRASMASAAARFGRPDAARDLADIVFEAMRA